ncbi:MAG: hypothetical protein IH927_07430, partial [Proteobacteria bacterium]|nr:hypothetical protein [Pseudomonadota bacterium]
MSATPIDYQLVDEGVVVAYLLQHWDVFGFDTETTSPTHGKKKVFATDEADMV